MIGKFARIQSDDRIINQLQSNVARSLDPVAASPIVDGVVLQSVALLSGVTNVVNHRLGRTLTGWCLIRLRKSATVYDVQDADPDNSNKPNPIPDKTLFLRCSTNVTVDLYVF